MIFCKSCHKQIDVLRSEIKELYEDLRCIQVEISTIKRESGYFSKDSLINKVKEDIGMNHELIMKELEHIREFLKEFRKK